MNFNEMNVNPFIRKLVGIYKHRKLKDNLHSNNRLKHIKRGWDKKINILQQLMVTCGMLE